METKVTQTHFFIEELNYKTYFPSDMFNSTSNKKETINQSTKAKVGVHKNFTNFYFEISTDLETYFKDEDTGEEEKYRSLTLTVSFFYDLELPLDLKVVEDENALYLELKDSLNKYILDHCRQQMREIVRQVTSIDYQSSLLLDDIVIQIN